VFEGDVGILLAGIVFQAVTDLATSCRPWPVSHVWFQPVMWTPRVVGVVLLPAAVSALPARHAADLREVTLTPLRTPPMIPPPSSGFVLERVANFPDCLDSRGGMSRQTKQSTRGCMEAGLRGTDKTRRIQDSLGEGHGCQHRQFCQQRIKVLHIT
jgi:hypothetical protein